MSLASLPALVALALALAGAPGAAHRAVSSETPAPSVTPARAATASVTQRLVADGRGEGLVTRSDTVMGTSLEILVVAPPGPEVEAAIDAAVAELRRVEDLVTTWRPSALTRFNDAAGHEVHLDDEVLALLEEAKRVCLLTGRSFDPTFQGAARVWDFRHPGARPPTPEAAREAFRAVDCRRLTIDRERGIARLDPGMAVGLGGIAKGYAVGRAARILRERGYEGFVVNAGGDLYASGRHDGRIWRVGIRHPRDPDRDIAVLPATGYAVATSGDYERYFDYGGKRYHHILSPRTGFPAAGCQSVTILARDPTLADALATGVFVMGPEEGLALVERLDGVETLIIDTEGNPHMSEGLRHPPRR